jgi:hypothetical protein
VSGELEDGALTVWASADAGNVGGIVDGYDDAGCKDDLLPLYLKSVCPNSHVLLFCCTYSLANIDHIDTIRPGLPQVRLHVHLEVLRAEMALRCEQHLDILVGLRITLLVAESLRTSCYR